MKRRLALLLVFLMMFSLFSMAAYGVEISEKKVTLYYPNGDWSLTPIEAKLSFLDESDLYLKALQQLTDPKSLPAGCYDEFPESFKVEGVRIEKNAAYVIISEAAFVDSGLSNSWLTTLEEIISYNLFNLNKEIDNIKFFSSSKATKSINSIKEKRPFFSTGSR